MSITRTLDGVDLPVAGTWTIDPGHAEVAFVGRHFGLTKVRGRFTDLTGTLVLAEDPDASTLEVVVQMASVHSGDDARDAHLRSDDLFDVEAHPTAMFVATNVVPQGRHAVVTGDLTIKGISRPVDLRVEYLGAVTDPWGNDRAVFTASATIDREDWGIGWNMILETGGFLVSKRIDLQIEVELIREDG